MRPGSRTRAFTLIELAVYSAVLLLLMAGVYSVVEGGARYFRLAQAHETVNQQAAIAVRKLSTELANASQSATYHNDLPQDYLLFLSPAEPMPITSTDYTFVGPLVEWKKWVCYYRTGGSDLVRAEQALGAPVTDPSSPPVPDFTTDILPLPSQPIAHNVSEIDFTTPTAAVVGLEVVAEAQTASDKTTTVRLVSSVRLINL